MQRRGVLFLLRMRSKQERVDDDVNDHDCANRNGNKRPKKNAETNKKTEIVKLPMPMASNYSCEHLLCTAETASRTLDEFGVAIIPGVLNQAQCGAMYRGMWSFVEHVSNGVVSEVCGAVEREFFFFFFSFFFSDRPTSRRGSDSTRRFFPRIQCSCNTGVSDMRHLLGKFGRTRQSSTSFRRFGKRSQRISL